ncbi:unnamed protein product [Cylicocyclus nassatus]|uniref:Uncharacterized protein n=1 Tax=Cylicocyclus nassatus TaxID=53992 RepID=A0AA36MBB0_CYLNA|nr:unnamed protein product [Cylicocyclus nassatus]
MSMQMVFIVSVKTDEVRTSLVIFLTGTVRSRNVWQVFNYFFGDEEEHHEQNSIPDDDEDRDKRKNISEGTPAVKEEDNEISRVDPYTQGSKGKYTDNRVGVIHTPKNSSWTDEGYRKYLEELASYLENLSTQDNGFGEGAGFAYTHFQMSFGRVDEYGYFIGEGGGAFDDFGDPDYDIDDVYPVFSDYSDSDYGHDELK